MRPSANVRAAYLGGYPVVGFTVRGRLDDRGASATARRLLRATLLQFEPGNGQQLELRRDARGKPELASAHGAGAPAPPAVSIAHSRHTIGVAMARARQVGLDIETPATPSARLARRVFASSDADRILREGPGASADFARSWTVAEACAKASGRGLAELFGGVGPIGTDRSGFLGALRWRSAELPTDDLATVACSDRAPSAATFTDALWFPLASLTDVPAIPEGSRP